MDQYVSPIILKKRKIRFDQLGTPPQIQDKAHYKACMKKWQTKLLHVQQAYFHQHKRAIVVFEGWDASGKGGAIRRLTENLDPRGFVVHPIASPTAEEQGRHYLYRFQARLPKPGRIAIFDRSWYGRVLVERVEKLTEKRAWRRAYQEINEFERMLTDDGVRIIKLFMHISPEEQLARFKERLHNPYKRWKLTEEDIRNRARWHDYEAATEDMFDYTDTQHAPWHLITAEHKWYARVHVMETIVKALSKHVDISPPPLDEDFIKLAEEQLGLKAAKK
ncbi:polyphosphate kinase 2 family protein [Alteromonas sp. 14N.309.X.WAT.G.H12]|uniref:polyphosphate kinase 2 family protein n=1 Tax=Alteromonas sp. 14N.309.X.WAT.G.H12 TaxID=3120824 RepID=UPI002FCF6730